MYDFITREEFKTLLEQATKPLLERIAQLEAETEQWVDTKTAMRLTGIRSDNTLRLERIRPGTLLEHIGAGKSIRYSRSSCMAYADSRKPNFFRTALPHS